MRAVTRRLALVMTSAMCAGAFPWPVRAIEPAKNLKEVWSEIQAGNFDLAVQRLQLHATEWPLDRELRSNLAVMQFAAEMFDKAEENLRWVAKLRRGGAPIVGPRFETDYLEAWYRLAQLRAGRTPDNQPPASPHSLLAVLARAEDQSFATEFADAYFAYLDDVESDIGGKKTVVVKDGVTATTIVNVARPERRAVEQAYLCIGSFMLGEQALGLDDRVAGKKFLAIAVATQADGEVEFHIAKAELARLG